MKRRNFLKGSLGTLYMMASPNMAFPDVKLSEKRLLVVLLRGGLDGLAAVPPLADKNLSKIRKDVLVQGANDLDGFFGIHPNLKFLENEYHSGNAAFCTCYVISIYWTITFRWTKYNGNWIRTGICSYIWVGWQSNECSRVFVTCGITSLYQ
jgi:uncharacterized protein (DUF1501 family)